MELTVELIVEQNYIKLQNITLKISLHKLLILSCATIVQKLCKKIICTISDKLGVGVGVGIGLRDYR